MPTWILLAVKSGVALTVFALGLEASWSAATYLVRRPVKLAKATLAMYAIMPLVTATAVALFDLKSSVAVALIALSVAPIPPVLPRKASKAGGRTAYATSLLVLSSVVAIVFVPAAVELLGRAFGKPASASTFAIAGVVGKTVLAPLAVGMLVHAVAPVFARRIRRGAAVGGALLLVAGAAPLLVGAMPAMRSQLGQGTLVVILAFVVVGTAAGHWLGGPEPDERVVLGLTTASRHPGVAFVVAAANHSDPKAVFAALLLYLLVNAVVSIPYARWAHHRLVPRRAVAPAR